MTGSEPRRPALQARIAAAEQGLAALHALDGETVMGGVPEALRGPLSVARFRTRLVARHARHCGAPLYAGPADDREALLMAEGSDGIAALAAGAGAQVLWREFLRILRRADLDILSQRLGVDPHDAARPGREAAIMIAPIRPVDPADLEGLAEAALDEGALCWACWLVHQDETIARRLRAMTPLRVTRRLPRCLPGDLDSQAARRAIIDARLDAIAVERRDRALQNEVA